jgi:hypothetical protein
MWNLQKNANIVATYSMLQISVIIEGEETLDNIVLGLCRVVHNCPEFGREFLEFITAICLGSDKGYFEPMKWLKVPVNSHHTQC